MSNFLTQDPIDAAKGAIPRDFVSQPVGSLPFAPRSAVKLIPRVEWKDRIAEKTVNRSWIWNRCQRLVPRLNQQRYQWCHGFAAVGAAMCARAMAGLPYVELSASSVAGPVTNWNPNAGQYITVDMKQIATVGIAETHLVPMLTHDRRFWTPEAIANAGLHKMKCLDLDATVFDEVVTFALMDIVTVWCVRDWKHSIYGGVELRIRNGVVEVRGVNSWDKSWGDDGTLWTGEHETHYPSEAYGLLVPDSK